MPGRDHADDEGPWLQFVKSTLTTSSYKPITFMILYFYDMLKTLLQAVFQMSHITYKLKFFLTIF